MINSFIFYGLHNFDSFFLPNFIRLIKTRKYVILINEKEVIFLKDKFTKNQFIISKSIQKNFTKIKILLEKEFNLFLFVFPSTNKISIDTKLVSMLHNNALYYDATILSLIYLKPNILNLKV